MPSDKVTPREFIEIWQTSDSVPEVCEKSGMTYEAVTSRAYYYRRKGIPLKDYRKQGRPTGAGRRPLDVEGLKEFAEKTLEESYQEDMEVEL